MSGRRSNTHPQSQAGFNASDSSDQAQDSSSAIRLLRNKVAKGACHEVAEVLEPLLLSGIAEALGSGLVYFCWENLPVGVGVTPGGRKNHYETANLNLNHVFIHV